MRPIQPKPLPQIPVIGQREQVTRIAVQQQVQQLTSDIYSRAVAALLAAGLPNRERQRQLARDSLTAAKDYFEGLGLAQFQPPEHPREIQQ